MYGTRTAKKAPRTVGVSFGCAVVTTLINILVLLLAVYLYVSAKPETPEGTHAKHILRWGQQSKLVLGGAPEPALLAQQREQRMAVAAEVAAAVAAAKASCPKPVGQMIQNQARVGGVGGVGGELPPCTDPVWCAVQMPSQSYFKFEPPTDPLRWRIAQLQASSGEQVLLKRLVNTFPGHHDFLDGDIRYVL
jgi:hypothetical protein